MKKQRKCSKQNNKIKLRKKQNKRKKCNETQISNLPDKELKVMVIKMLTELRRRIDKYGEKFNKETENIRKSNRSHRADEYNYRTKITPKGFNNRLDEAEESVNLKTWHLNSSNQSRKNKKD